MSIRIFFIIFFIFISGILFSLDGFYFSEENAYFFIFKENLCNFSRFYKDGNLRDFSFDLSEDKVSVFLPENNILNLMKFDESNLMSEDPIYGGLYAKKSLTRGYAALSDLTRDVKAKIDLLTKSVSHFSDENDNIYKSEILLKRGNLFLEEKKYDDALKDFEKSIEVYPQNRESYNYLAICYVYLGELDRGLKILDSLTNFLPSDKDEISFFLRGGLNAAKGEYLKAIEDLSKCIEISPDYKEAYVQRGDAYFYNDDYKNALADYEKFYELAPDSKDMFENEKIAREKIEAEKKYSTNFPADDKKDLETADNYYGEGFYKDALKYYEKYLIKERDDAKVYFRRGFCFFVLKELDKSLADFEKASLINNEGKEFFFYKGLINFLKDNYSEALNNFNDSILIDERFVVAHIFRTFASIKVSPESFKKFYALSKEKREKILKEEDKILFDYFYGDIDLTSFLNILNNSEKSAGKEKSTAYFVIALKKYINGHFDDAKTAFNIVSEIGYKFDFGYYFAKILLKR